MSAGEAGPDDLGFDNPAPPGPVVGKGEKKANAAKTAPTPPPPVINSFGTQPGPSFAAADPDFDAVGFGAAPGVTGGDDDDTPPSGIYVGGEEVQVIDAASIGRALAQANGLPIEYAAPKVEELRKGLVGIDLGASFAAIARFNDDGKHEIVPNAEDETVTPVHVFFDEDGERLVGREARRLAPSAPDRAFPDAKSLLTKAGFAATVGDSKVSAEDVLASVAKKLIDDCEQRTGERPTHAALAAPAWFKDAERAALQRAVEKTGVQVVGVTDEPLAATVPYSLRLNDLNPRRAAVFDLGHSGLGCAFVQCAKGDIEILGSEARRDLGATRWDQILADEGAKHFKAQHGFDARDDKGALLDLMIRAEEAKKTLSQKPNVTLVISARGKTSKVQFTRPAFEQAAKGLLAEAKKFLNDVRAKAGIKDWKEIDALILAGGGTRIPMVRRMVVQETGREPEKGVNPDEGVAIGALYWGMLARSKNQKPEPSRPDGPKKK